MSTLFCDSFAEINQYAESLYLPEPSSVTAIKKLIDYITGTEALELSAHMLNAVEKMQQLIPTHKIEEGEESMLKSCLEKSESNLVQLNSLFDKIKTILKQNGGDEVIVDDHNAIEFLKNLEKSQKELVLTIDYLTAIISVHKELNASTAKFSSPEAFFAPRIAA